MWDSETIQLNRNPIFMIKLTLDNESFSSIVLLNATRRPVIWTLKSYDQEDEYKENTRRYTWFLSIFKTGWF